MMSYAKMAKQKLTGCWTAAVLITLLYSVLMGALSATVLGSILLGGPLWYGLHTFYLGQIRMEKPGVGVLFDGLHYCLGTSIVVYLLQGIFTFLWSLLFFIPGIVKSYSYAMAPYILVDHPDMDALEVIDESRAMMDGNKWRLFCLDVSFLGWILLCVLTLGIGYFWLIPYMGCARAQFYEVIRSEYEQDKL